MIDLDKLKQALKDRDRIRTHSEGCHLWHHHRDCAIGVLIRELEEARSEVERLRRESQCPVCGRICSDCLKNCQEAVFGD